jgi:hypothetical protein
LNKLSTSTLRGDDFVQLPDLGMEGGFERVLPEDVQKIPTRTLAAHDNYLVWSRLGQCASSLPATHPRREFLIALAMEGTFSRRLLRRYRIRRATAVKALRELMERFGLKYQNIRHGGRSLDRYDDE